MEGTLKAEIGAVVCVIVWGLTFIYSKDLMSFLSPLQLMGMRFLIAFIVLSALCPKWSFDIRKEWVFVLMALFGNLLYFITENMALTYTYTSEVCILTSTTSMMSLVLMHLVFKDRIGGLQGIGFLVALIGVILVAFNGVVVMNLDPIGDALALTAAFSWAVYCLLLRMYGKDTDGMVIARKMMFYGLLMSLPLMLIEGHSFDPGQLFEFRSLFGLLFLGVLGSGLCFVLWNRSVKEMGVVKSNIFIYAMPVVTLIAGHVAFDEQITLMAIAGIALVIMGMVMANRNS